MRFPFPEGELETWAALGAVTDRSVRVWFRDVQGEPAVARLLVDQSVAAEAALQPSREHDGIAVADLRLADPRPNTAFTVEVKDVVRHGRLAPSPGTPSAFSFAFGSCHQPFESLAPGSLAIHSGAAIYPAMAPVLRAHDTRFLLLVGDQMYSDGVESINIRRDLKENGLPLSDDDLRDLYRHLYRGYFNQSGFRRLLEEWPAYLIWDDHDIFDGAGSYLKGDDFDRRLFRAAEQAYREYQHLRNPGASLEDRAPYHYQFWYGDVGFLVLDLRGVRDYQSGTLLGERQWRDLDGFLAAAAEREVSTVFLVMSIPLVHHSPALMRLMEWVPGSKGTDVRDRWGVEPYWTNRNSLLERFLNWQSARPARQIIILSGDVHTGGAFQVRRRHGPGVIHQWTSSPLTTPTGPRHRIVNLVGTQLVNWGQQRYRVIKEGLENRNNFGLVTVRPLDSGGHRVEFLLYGHRRGGDLQATLRIVTQPTRQLTR